jgi:hypothetical protein
LVAIFATCPAEPLGRRSSRATRTTLIATCSVFEGWTRIEMPTLITYNNTNRLHLAISLSTPGNVFRECITPIFGARPIVPQTNPHLGRSFASLKPWRESFFWRGPGSCPGS